MQSIQQLLQAIQDNPRVPSLHYDLGGLYLADMQTDKARACYQQALRLAPNHPQILLQLGNTENTAQRYQEATVYFKQCIAITPDDAAAYYNLGNALRALGQPDEAAKQYQQSLKLTPNDADAHNNLGNVLRDLGRLDESIACYQQALAINPQLHHALAHLIHQKQHICDWQGLDAEIAQLRQVFAQSPQAQIPPFAFLAMPGTTAQEQLQCASQWAQQQFGHIAPPPSTHQGFKAAKPIKVGYLAADFRLHPLAFLITELLAAHDHTRFHITAYSYGPNDHSQERAAIQHSVDHFEDIQTLSDIEAAQLMQTQQIDILVDLTGYTKHSRTAIVALKPAPISINWLGYPGSMGKVGAKSVFDYVIVDETIAPQAEHFAEKCIYLPCYQPNNQHRPVAEPSSKSALGIPEDAFVFCCFNQTFKITAEVYAVWMQLLQAIPNSVLWLLDCNVWAKANLIATANQAGIAAERILFAPRVSIAVHLARHAHADLFLDTQPYNAHTTASDALWMGLPVLTCMGETFPSRVAASLLHQLGLDALVTQSLSEFAERARALAQDTDQLKAVKQQLMTQRKLLFNPDVFVQALETAYIHAYNNLCAPPDV
ncbi:tetratricopeptide repeat protein [Methylotenera sp. 1P/1]|uniref:O-linked N-acetylglucosamine transferase, SPINDLY family protein n=1 Tax=Methylotenera sp. 1P/1 TaxID=1131551 RepID=UPI00036EA0C1|nr:tetratricopeptide repeat protein [Methylotenera sp. 1P/1]